MLKDKQKNDIITQLPDFHTSQGAIKQVQYTFPNVQQGLNLPTKTIITEDGFLIELGNERRVQQTLNIPCPNIQNLHVFWDYKQDGIDIYYLVIDAERNLHVVSRKANLQILATIDQVADVKIDDFSGSGHCEVKLRRCTSRTWELFNVTKFAISDSTESANNSEKITAPLHNALESSRTRLKYYSNIFAKKRMLRAKVVSAVDPERQAADEHLQVIFCKYFYLHGRCVQIVKVKSRDELENLKIIPYTSANLNILQPAGVAGLSRDSVKILVSIFGPYCSNLNFTTALEYNIDDVKYYVPLPLLLLHSVINTRQQLEVLSAEDCLDVLTKASAAVCSVHWPSSGDYTWQLVQRSLRLTPIVASVDNSIQLSCCELPELVGLYVISEPKNKRAILCLKERMQLKMVKFLLQQHPILFKQTGFKVKHADKMGLANDLHLIFKKKDLATKSVSLRNYFQILQELIHGMSSFKD